ncbi:MAG: hypothetical protein IJF48_00495 [Clostridia bacterium]|nr:hypothetical protein [Clostridia bacterium]
MQSDNSPTPKKPRKVKPVGADGHRARMFERFLGARGNDVSPRDIIEMLLYFSIRVRDTRDSAVDLMERFDGNIDRLFNATPENLCRTDGIGKTSALLLGVVGDMADRVGALEDEDEDICGRHIEGDELGEVFLGRHDGARHDVTWAVFFDSSMCVICIEQAKDAPLDADGDDVFSLISRASRYHASAVAVARMSSDYICYPTMADFKLAQKLETLFASANLELVEYYIVTADDSFGVKKIFHE